MIKAIGSASILYDMQWLLLCKIIRYMKFNFSKLLLFVKMDINLSLILSSFAVKGSMHEIRNPFSEKHLLPLLLKILLILIIVIGAYLGTLVRNSFREIQGNNLHSWYFTMKRTKHSFTILITICTSISGSYQVVI